MRAHCLPSCLNILSPLANISCWFFFFFSQLAAQKATAAAAPKMSSKRKKRLEAYITRKLKKEGRKDLIASLA